MLILKPLRAPSLASATAALLLFATGPSFVAAQNKSHAPPATGSAPAAAAPAPASGAPPAGAPAVPASHPQQFDLRVTLKSLEEWDTTIDSLVNLSWTVHSVTTTQDLGGHDLDYYWQQHVLTLPTKEKLDSLRDKAQKQSVAKDTAGLQQTLAEASAIMTGERAKAFAISVFMNVQAPLIYHQYQLGPWLARATDADRQGINDRVNATYQMLAKDLDDVLKLREPENPGVTVQRFFSRTAQPLAFFNSERERLVKAQADLPNPVAVPPHTRGDKACPPPIAPVKGRDKASLAPDFPSSEGFYPATAKGNGVEGAVTVRVQVSETGCAQRAEVAGTSGVAELDDGALNLAMAGNYVPAAGAGDKAVAGTVLFRVKFEEADPPAK